MKNTDKPKKQVFWYASTYYTPSTWTFLIYSVTPLFFLYSSHSEQEVLLPLLAHQT